MTGRSRTDQSTADFLQAARERTETRKATGGCRFEVTLPAATVGPSGA
ncbi:hypothetical protein ACFQVC_09515 [Streptomyces monticola]|uniref:Uncharacterized protein n=1 Tax=Streptomyces monticola TaxID=2666263 RepID=A0ABW2JGN4_9ACTN